MTDADGYVRLNVEGYGGMLCAPWMDRPLTVAGRVLVQDGDTIRTKLVYVDKDLLLIPHVAIHMDSGANKDATYNKKTDMVPLYGLNGEKGGFMAQVAQAADCAVEDILGSDLYLRLRQPALKWGVQGEFISAAKLDDLQCVDGCLQGFLEATAAKCTRPVADADVTADAGSDAAVPADGASAAKSVALFGLLDNEEVGSLTKQGADGTFMEDTCKRICKAMGKDKRIAQANSFMVSADNAHAVHPNHPEYADATHRPHLNEGIVIKHGVRYATDGASQAVFAAVCRKAGVPVQFFFNRSDLMGGSTLGNISNAHVSVNTVDIGLPQLAMHSCYETAGAKDTDYLIQAMAQFFGSSLTEENGTFVLR